MKNISIVFSLLFFSLSCIAQHSKKVITSSGYQVGDKAEDFELKNVDGKMLSLSEIKNAKGYIVIFTSNKCPFAIAYEDRIIDLHNKMAPMGYPVVAINSNDGSSDSPDSFDAMITRHKEKQFPFLYLKDEKEVYTKFGAIKTPHVFLLDSDKVVRYIGAIDDSPREPMEVKIKYVENAIAAIEKGENPDPEFTKAIGCPISSKGQGGRKGGRKGPPAPDQIMKDMDKNNDKKISKEEAQGPLARDFDRIDKNKDGVLTMEELSNLRKK